MAQVIRLSVPTELLSFVRLAQLLDAIDQQGKAVDPQQYRLLVDKLNAELREHQAHPALDELLPHFPAAAELYENLQYAHAGLVRTPLELSLSSELAAREALAKMASRD